MKRRFLLVSLFAVMSATTGCAYMKDRALDFVDCFKADVGIGLGVDANFRLTNFITGGAGMGLCRVVGFRGRHAGTWVNLHAGLPIMPVLWFIMVKEDEPFYTDLSVIGTASGLPEPFDLFGSQVDSPKNNDGYVACSILFFSTYFETEFNIFKEPKAWNYFEEPVYLFDIEAGVVAGIVAARLGFSPGEFADFLTGWFGADIAGDDTKPEEDEESKDKDNSEP